MANIGIIGSFGDVIFETSTKRIRTFNDFTRSGTSRWGIHEIIGQKPLSEYIGPGQEEISFTVRLDVSLGINPAEELKKLREIRDTGSVNLLIIGGETVTTNYWYLESISEQQKIFTGQGLLTLAIVEIKLKEYTFLGVV